MFHRTTNFPVSSRDWTQRRLLDSYTVKFSEGRELPAAMESKTTEVTLSKYNLFLNRSSKLELTGLQQNIYSKQTIKKINSRHWYLKAGAEKNPVKMTIQ